MAQNVLAWNNSLVDKSDRAISHLYQSSQNGRERFNGHKKYVVEAFFISDRNLVLKFPHR